MTLSIAALLDSKVTREQAEAKLREYIANAPLPIPVETLDTPGTHESAFLYAMSSAEAERSDMRLRFAEMGYRSTASRDGVALIAIETYGLSVRGADYATTHVIFTNSSGAQYPFEAGELRVLNSETGKLYEITEPITIQPATISGPWESDPIGVRALDPGTESNATSGQIDALETQLNGVTVANEQPAIGQDEEDKDSINRRIDAAIGLLGVEASGVSTGGPQSAIEAIALSGRDRKGGCVRPDGSRVTVTRTKVVRDDATGAVTLYVADDDGPLDSGDLAIVEAEVQAYAEWICSTISVLNVTLVTIEIAAELSVTDTALSDEEIEDIVSEALLALSKRSRIGGFGGIVPREYIEGGLRGAGQWTVVDVDMSSPPSSPNVTVSQVINLVLATDGLTITRVA